MLALLRVRNLAIIEELEVELGPGLNILTGETGAGKSILVLALRLVLGDRAPSGVVRTGADAAHVEALFDLSQDPVAMARLAEDGIECDGEVVVRRTIYTSGRTRAYINGRLTTLAQLARLHAADLRDLDAVSQPGAVVVAIGRDEHLRLRAQAAEGDRMNDPVAVALEFAARPARPFAFLGEFTAAAGGGIGSVGSSVHARRGLGVRPRGDNVNEMRTRGVFGRMCARTAGFAGLRIQPRIQSAAATGSRQWSVERGRIAVTPLRTGPSPTTRGPSPRMRVAWPT